MHCSYILHIIWLSAMTECRGITRGQWVNSAGSRWRLNSLHCWPLMVSYDVFFVSSKTKTCATFAKDPSHKSHDASCRNPMMHHFVTEICTHMHIAVTKWCIVGYGTSALWDLCNRSITMLHVILCFLTCLVVNIAVNKTDIWRIRWNFLICLFVSQLLSFLMHCVIYCDIIARM